MVNDLAYGPATQPIRYIELALGEARDSSAEVTRRIGEPGEQSVACIDIGWRSRLKLAYRIA
jgi:hypothetical protein